LGYLPRRGFSLRWKRQEDPYMPEPGDTPSDRAAATPPGAPAEPTLIDSIADLLQVIVDWLRQEAESTVKNKVVLPLQQLGLTMLSAQLAVTLVLLGAIFISVGSMILLADWVGWPGALYIVGGTCVLIALILAFIAGKWWQK
jgi:hypothetical protein